MAEASPNSHLVLSTFNLLQAPQDVQRSVLLAMDIRELVICGRTCTSLKSLINSDIAIRYKLALARTGRMDGTSSVPIVDRLTALRNYRDAFSAGGHPLRRAPLHPFGSLPNRSRMPFVFEDSVPLWRPAATFSGTEELKITHTVQRLGLEGHRGGSCVIDPAQDLLVFSRRVTNHNPLQVTTEVCIYSLSQGRPHPLATRTYIRSNLKSQYPLYTEIADDLQILGDLLAWNLLDGRQHEMRVFHWKTGVTVWELTTATVVWWHCRLISPRHVVVVAVKSLLIYPLDCALRDHAPPSSPDTASCVLSLPVWSENVTEPNFPATTSYIHFPPAPGPTDRPLFQHDPALTVLALYLEFGVAGTPARRTVAHEQYVLFVPVATLTAQADLSVPAALPPAASPAPRAVPWEAWGPTGTRLVRPMSRCTVSSFGCTVALAQTQWTGPHATLSVYVFDVHPWARPRHGADAATRGLVCVAETLLDTPAFKLDSEGGGSGVRTAFPCEFTRRDVPLETSELYARVVLAEDGLVLVG